MTPLGWLAAIILFVQLPIPLFWFVMHPQIDLWRNHRSTSYATAPLVAWVPVTFFLVISHRKLFFHAWPPVWSAIVGFALLLFEAWIFWSVKRDLGAARLIGELSGGGEMARQGIYARIRHLRYVGSLLAIIGACFLADTQLMWTVAGMWMVLTSMAISTEEREWRARFGAAYEDYCCQVPRLVPRSSQRGEG